MRCFDLLHCQMLPCGVGLWELWAYFGKLSGFLTFRCFSPPPPFWGATGPNPGFQAVCPVAGPMGRSVADLERMARVLFGDRGGGQHYFPAPIPYQDVALPEKLRFGYYLNGASCVALD